MVKKTSRTFIWIILGLALLGFGGYGTVNFGGRIRSAGTVGETDIDAGRYFRELNAELNAYQAQVGQALPMAQAQAMGLDRMVLARVIAMAAIDNEASRLGISVGDEEVRRQLLAIPDFQGVSGKFDRDTYKFVLEQNRLTAAEFEANLRADGARALIQSAVTSGVVIAPAYVETLFDYAYETRDFTWAALNADQLETQPAEPAEADLTAYYEANPEAFTLPRIKRITYAWLSPEGAGATVEVGEADLRALYEERIEEYRMPERRIVERLVFASTAEAQAAADALAAGSQSFDDLVAARGLTLGDIDMGDVTEADLGAAGAAVFALAEPGSVAGPAESDLGPALFRMNAILAAQETSFEEARDALLVEFAADRARRQIADLIPELDDLLAGGATLEELASDHGLRLGQIDWFAGSTDGIAAYDSFREAAQAVSLGDYPELMLMDDGGAFALRLDGVVEPRLQSLDEVRGDVAASWLAQERTRLLKTQAESYLPRFEAGESPSSIGLTEVQETGQGRDAFIDGTPADFAAQVFEAEPGSWRIVENGAGVIVMRVDAVHAADRSNDEAKQIIAAFSARSAQEIGLDLEIAFADALQKQAGITLNQPVINAINGQFP
jgi:peptidyl-prolyl cis-trans isomerase D